MTEKIVGIERIEGQCFLCYKKISFRFQALKDVPRQAYILTTKVGKYSPDVLKMYDYSFSRTEESVNNSLNRLQVDCIDIVQVLRVLWSVGLSFG